MNLSEYLNILYPAIGGRQTKLDFITSLILNSTLKTNRYKTSELESHLWSLSENWYGKIYNGHATLGKNLAGEIINIFDSKKYRDYLTSEFSQDSIECIGEKFKEKGISIEDDDIIALCVFLFREILIAIAYKPRKKTQKETNNKFESKDFSIMDLDPFALPKECNVSPEFIIQLQRERQMWASKYDNLQ